MNLQAERAAIGDRIREAAARRARLSIRGGDTKQFLGEPAQGEALDTRGLSGVILYEPSELVIKAGGGTPLAQIEAALAECGQCLPFEPPRFDGGTLGGMVASGLAGPARASVGSVRDYVLGASLINGRGEDLHFGGEVMKNVAGYDVARLLAGSMGTLGVIADVSLKVLPVAKSQATLAFDCTQADALRLLNGWGGQPLPLNASRWVPAPGSGADGVLWLRLRGARAAVAAACRHLGGETVDPAQADAVWADWRDLRDPLLVPAPGQALWRLSVPQTAPVLDLAGTVLLDWHGAQRWLCAAPDQAARIRAAAKAVRGHASLVRLGDPGMGGLPPRFDRIEPTLLRIQTELMSAFDPHAVFDRRRLLADA